MNTLTTLLHHGFFALIPAVGFALLFNVPVKALKYCAAAGALGVMLRYLGLEVGLSLVSSTLIAATVIGCLGVYWAKHLQAHPKVFTVAAIIPMLPGVYAFKAMASLVRMSQQGYSPELFSALVDSFLTAAFVVGALALGLTLPGLLFYRRRSVV